MKRHGSLWEPMLEWENFLLAAHKAERGNRLQCVLKFLEALACRGKF